MVFRIAGSIFFFITALISFGVGIPVWALGITAAVAGIALLASKE